MSCEADFHGPHLGWPSPAYHIHSFHCTVLQLLQGMRGNVCCLQPVWRLQQDARAIQSYITQAQYLDSLDLQLRTYFKALNSTVVDNALYPFLQYL